MLREASAPAQSSSPVPLLHASPSARSAVNIVFALAGAWGLVVFWSITSRGRACRQRAHSSFYADFLPSSETLQVIVQSSFVQLVLCLSLHMVQTGGYGWVALWGMASACVGATFIALLNSWVRGESVSLRDALSVDRIDKHPEGWTDELEGETAEERRAARVEYAQLYEPGDDRRGHLGRLAAHDWESYHLDMERQMGLGMFDLSSQVFDEVKPETDPGLLAAFLNTNLFGALSGKRSAHSHHRRQQPPEHPEMLIVPVELPGGLAKATLRDAMLQWRLRHTAHAREAEAVDWLLGQLDPDGFELLRVKVPEQARLLVIEALVQFAQQHAELQMEAGHATKLKQTLQQLTPRFHHIDCPLPDDGHGTEKIRELVASALHQRIERTNARDITMEEGLLLQNSLHSLVDAFSLLPLASSAGHPSAEDQEFDLRAAIENEADQIRDKAEDYLCASTRALLPCKAQASSGLGWAARLPLLWMIRLYLLLTTTTHHLALHTHTTY